MQTTPNRELSNPEQTMSFHFLNSFRKIRLFSQSTAAAASKISTGLTGLKVDPSARKNLLKLYGDLEIKLKQLPTDYGYRNGMLSLIEERNKLINNESLTDFELEMKIGEGQLEELIEQAKEEHGLFEKLSNEWKPWKIEITQ